MKPANSIRHSNVCPPALAHLDAAYRATAYVVHLPQQDIALHVDEACPALDVWLARQGHASWAFLTACNPGSRKLPDNENAQRQTRLKAAAEADDHAWMAADGIPDDPSWKQEPSLFIPGIAVAAAAELAARFGQNAFLWGLRNGSAQLLYLCRD